MSLVSPLGLHLVRAMEAVLAGAEQAAGLAGILAVFWEAGAEQEMELELELGLHALYRVVGCLIRPREAEHLRKIRQYGSAAEGRCCCLWAVFAAAHRHKVARWYLTAEAIQRWAVSCGTLDSFNQALCTYGQRRRSIDWMLLLVVPHPPSPRIPTRPRHRRCACIRRGV